MSKDWRDDAACREIPTELFFSEKDHPTWVVQKAVDLACNACAVRVECLESAMREEQHAASRSHRFGIRGGLNPRQRAEFWKDVLSRGAGWCPANKHIIEREESKCRRCELEVKRARRTA